MDQIFSKVGSYWIGQKANKELSSVSKDINSVGTTIDDGAKWIAGKIKGSMQKPLEELLKEYDLPVGIFPSDATGYDFNEKTKLLTVNMPSICEVGYQDSSVLRLDSVVTGYLEKSKLTDIDGLKTKVMIWIKVSSITSEGSKLHFQAGMRKTRSRDAYEVLTAGVSVSKF